MTALTLAIHGPSGVGKSWLADTSPAPRLILDTEGGARFTPSAKVEWSPLQSPPEVAESAVARCRSVEELLALYRWLLSGKHPFRSVVIDSLTELRRRLAPDDELHVAAMVQAFVDLTLLPADPLECVAFICWDGEVGDVAYAVDVVTHLSMASGVRRAHFQTIGDAIAKDRTNRLGPALDNPTIPRMLARISEKETA